MAKALLWRGQPVANRTFYVDACFRGQRRYFAGVCVACCKKDSTVDGACRQSGFAPFVAGRSRHEAHDGGDTPKRSATLPGSMGCCPVSRRTDDSGARQYSHCHKFSLEISKGHERSLLTE